MGVLSAIGTVVVIRRIRERRRRRRAEEARRRAEEEGTDLLGPGVMALAATIEGVRLATQVAKVGADVGRQGLAPALAGSLRLLADYAETDRPNLRRVVADDGTVTLMFSDIEGSTSINEELGDQGWLELLKEHDAIVRGAIRQHRGQVIKTQGDSFMVAFKELVPAVECAIAVQQGLDGADMGRDLPIRVRIGLHHGEVTRQGRDVFGLNVALAARVAAAAEGGEILVSEDVRKLVQKDDALRFGRGRTLQLKGISKAARVYPVVWESA